MPNYCLHPLSSAETATIGAEPGALGARAILHLRRMSTMSTVIMGDTDAQVSMPKPSSAPTALEKPMPVAHDVTMLRNLGPTGVLRPSHKEWLRSAVVRQFYWCCPPVGNPPPVGKAGFEVWVLPKGGLVSVHHCSLRRPRHPAPQRRHGFPRALHHPGAHPSPVHMSGRRHCTGQTGGWRRRNEDKYEFPVRFEFTTLNDVQLAFDVGAPVHPA